MCKLWIPGWNQHWAQAANEPAATERFAWSWSILRRAAETLGWNRRARWADRAGVIGSKTPLTTRARLEGSPATRRAHGKSNVGCSILVPVPFACPVQCCIRATDADLSVGVHSSTPSSDLGPHFSASTAPRHQSHSKHGRVSAPLHHNRGHGMAWRGRDCRRGLHRWSCH